MNLLTQFTDAFAADKFVLEIDDTRLIPAKCAAYLVLFQNDGIAISIDFERIAMADVHRIAQFNRDNDAPQLVDFSYDAGRLHKATTFRFIGMIRKPLK